MNNISHGLLEIGLDLKILTINTLKHPLNIAALPGEYLKNTGIETTFVDTRIQLLDIFLNLFTGRSYNVERFYSAEFEKKIADTLQKNSFDIIHLESLFATPYLDCIRQNSEAGIVYRAHNIEFEIWDELAKREAWTVKRLYLKFLAKRIKNYELGLINLVDGIAAISEEDVHLFKKYGCTIPMVNIPFGINIRDYIISSEAPEDPNIFFLGAMDWLPNREGVDWFIKECWSKINLDNAGLKFTIAGRSTPRSLMEKKISNVEFVGEVPDAKKFMLENGVMVVPLLSGSGIRVKIIEAMALGKVIIATTLAAKGINCEHKKNILIADSPAEFAEMTCLAASNNELRKLISQNARKFAEENFDNCIIIEKLISFYSRIAS